MLISEYQSVSTHWYQSTSPYLPTDIRVPAYIFPLIYKSTSLFYLLISEYQAALTHWYQSTSLCLPADIRVPGCIDPLLSEYQPIFSLWYIRVPACIYLLISEYKVALTHWYQSTSLYWPTDIRVPASVYLLISEYQSVPFFGFCFVSSCLLISSFSFSWENQTLTGNFGEILIFTCQGWQIHLEIWMKITIKLTLFLRCLFCCSTI